MPRTITSPMYSELLAMGVGFSSVEDKTVPTAGQTVAFADTPQNTVKYMDPAGTLATLTVNLPSNANSVIGQEVKLVSSQAITALTLGVIGGGGTAILGAPAGMTAGQTLIFTKVAGVAGGASVWAAK